MSTSLVVQWLRLHTPSASDPGLISGQGTRSSMLQLKIPHLKWRLKTLCAAAKTWCGQINKYQKKKKKKTIMLPILKFSLLNLIARMRTGSKLIRDQTMWKRNWDTAAGPWLVEKKRQYFASTFIMLPQPGSGLQETDSETEIACRFLGVCSGEQYL